MGTEEIPTEGQVDIVRQMNELLEAQAKLWEKVADSMSQAMQASQGLKGAAEGAAESQKKQNEQTQNLNDVIKENTEGTDGLTDALGRNSKQISINTDKLDEYAAVAIGAKVAVDSFNSGLNFLSGSWDLLTGGITSVIGLVSSGMKVVTGFFDGLFSAAADYRNKAGGEMFQANQDIIRQFGNLDETQGKFVKGLTKELAPAQAALGKANNSLWASIGNSAAILKEVTALAGDFGDSLVFLQDEVQGAASELLIMKKGMNLSADAMKNLGSMAKSSGQSLQESLTEGMVASAHLSKQFGVDVKIIGKNLSALAGDMESFGHLSTKEMAAVATYSAKLGVEIGALKGVMDTFDTFEGAAQSAGKLAEAFGMNIDAMAMMNAENPAERIDMLRQSLADTGQSFDELSRHEKKLMAQTMGMDMSSLQNAMSIDPDEMGFDDFGDAAEEAAAQMTPEEAMADVAKSIEKMSHAMTQMAEGPLANFMKGFMEVLERSPEWKELMNLIADWMKEFYHMGKAVGDLFLGFIRGPGAGVLDQLKNIFDLERIRAFKDDVVASFEKFFELLDTDPKAAMEGLFDDIMAAIEDWSSGTGEGATGISEMFMNILEGGIKLMHGLIPKVMETLAGWLVSLTETLKEWFEGDKTGQKNMTDGIGAALSAAFEDISNTWSDTLWPALSDLFGLLLEKAMPFIIGYLAIGFTVIFTKAIMTAMMNLAAAAIAKKVGGFLANLLGGNGGALDEAKKKLPKEAQPGSGEQKSMFSGMKQMFEDIASIKKADVAKAGVRLLIIAAFIGGAMVIFAGAVRIAAAVLSNTSWSDFAKAVIAVGIGVISTVALVAATKLLPEKDKMMEAALALLGAVVVYVVGVVAFAGAIRLAAAVLEPVKWENIAKVLASTIVGIFGTIALALAGVALGTALTGPQIGYALLGLLGAAVIFSIGVVAFAYAIKIAAGIMEKVEWNSLAKVIVGTTFGIISTVVLVGAAMLVGALLAGPQAALAVGGLLGAAFVFSVGVVAFSLAMAMAATVMDGVSWDSISKVLTVVGTSLLATVAMIAVAAGLGTPLGLAAMGFAALGLPAAALLFQEGIIVFGLAIASMMAATSMINMDKAMQTLDLVMEVMEATLRFVAVGSRFAFAVFPGSMKPIKKGVEALADIGVDAFEKFAKVIQVIERLPIRDPELFKLKMEGIGSMMEGTQKLAQLGLDAMDMAMVASTMSESGPEEMMNSMSNFIQGTIDSVTTLVVLFSLMAQGMDEGAIKGASAIAKIIATVADLAGKLMGPMTKIIGMNDDNWYQDNSANQLESMVGGIGKIFGSLKEHLPSIVKGILDATKEITNPDQFLKQAQGMESAFKGLTAIIGAVSKLYADAEKAGKGKGAKGWFTDGDIGADSMLGKMFSAVVSLFGPMGGLRRMVKATVSLLTDSKVQFPDKAIADNFRSGMDSMLKVIKDIVDFAGKWDDSKQKALTQLNLALYYWETGKKSSPSMVIKRIVGEAKSIAAAMEDVKIDLDKLPIKVLSDGVLGAKGERKFTIEPKGVNIQVNFSVEMNAEQLATQIYKGNKKNNKGGFFKLTDQAASSDLDKNP